MNELPLCLQIVPIGKGINWVEDHLREHMKSEEYRQEKREPHYDLRPTEFDFDKDNNEMLRPTGVDFDRCKEYLIILRLKASAEVACEKWVAPTRGSVEPTYVDEDEAIL